jgi:hypothetical protein
MTSPSFCTTVNEKVYIEDIDTRDFTGTEMLDTVRALAHRNEDGRWIHPTSKSEFMVSTDRLPASPAALPASANAQPILSGSGSVLENDANH